MTREYQVKIKLAAIRAIWDRLADMADGIMAAATDTVAIRAITSEEANLQTTLMEISSRLSRLEIHSYGSILVPPVGLGDVTFPVVNVWKSIL
ncbi:hypothetical protein AVEN_57752-1 [Araneus ventricosus]|uniref:Uncharacterized protein n=1 Tax=Araneus ventricosus TaxID=182803 RepID=A0A4Y2Q5H6_ARAVE|nr:hypothetical protein AVEN_57752-1 [Araneus ventricosus]